MSYGFPMEIILMNREHDHTGQHDYFEDIKKSACSQGFQAGIEKAIEVVRRYEIDGLLFCGEKQVGTSSIKHLINSLESLKAKESK